MILAKEIAEAVTSYVAARIGKCACSDEIEPIIAAKLGPVMEKALSIQSGKSMLTFEAAAALVEMIVMLSEEPS